MNERHYDIGKKLYEVRRAQLMTQRELHKLSGVHWTTISRLEGGSHKAEPSTVKRLAQSLAVSPSLLLGENDD